MNTSRPHTLGKDIACQLLPLLQQHISLKRVANTNGGEYAGACLACGGKDRFRVWPTQGRYWCRQCQVKGDAIQFLRDFHGYSFPEACQALGCNVLPAAGPVRLTLHRRHTALTAAKQAFTDWSREQLILLTDQHRSLLLEQQTCTIALRVLPGNPYWESRMAAVCDHIAVTAWDCDVLTYPALLAERVTLWKEASRGEGM